jgi:uncharacterized protein
MQDPRDFIQLDEIDKNGPQTYSRTYQLTPTELKREELANVGPLQLEASVRKGDLPGEYVVEGTAKIVADLECSRCVEPYPFASTSPFNLRFRPRSEASRQEEEVELTPDEFDIEFYTDRVVSLRDLANEQIQLSIPMKPLCEEKCLGLCPQCGTNRNREACKCEASIVDQRWGALHDIREQIAKKRES